MEGQNFQSLPLKRAYVFFEANGLAKQAATIRESKAKFLSYDSTLKRAMVLRELTHRIWNFWKRDWGLGVMGMKTWSSFQSTADVWTFSAKTSPDCLS